MNNTIIIIKEGLKKQKQDTTNRIDKNGTSLTEFFKYVLK